jgi:lipoyl-dependent peroxiredoxin subunit C
LIIPINEFIVLFQLDIQLEEKTMLKVGDSFPEFRVKAVSSNSFIELNKQSYPDKWLVFFFWPKDFTFVCPTEIAEFGRLNNDFLERDAQLIGGSIDSEFVHLAWIKHKEELVDLPFPMLADVKRELSHALGILDEKEGVAQRATFIMDPLGIIRFVMVTDLNVGRNPKEVLRVLDALQTDELCPCNWEKGEQTLTMATQSAVE